MSGYREKKAWNQGFALLASRRIGISRGRTKNRAFIERIDVIISKKELGEGFEPPTSLHHPRPCVASTGLM